MARAKKKARGRYHHGDLRTALLEVAVALIAERGIQGLSLRECARRLGVSHAAPYRHFPDKASLIAGLATQGFQWLTEAGQAAIEGLEEPIERLDAYGVAYVRFAIDNPEHHRVMFTSELDGAATDGGAFELLLETARAMVGDDEDEQLAAVSFWSLVHGLSMLIIDGRIPDEHIDSPEAIEALTRATFGFWRSAAASGRVS